MRRMVLFGVLWAAAGCRQEEAPRPGGARLEVLFDERHGLEGGEPVRFHDFVVGEVESVDLADARVRAVLSVDPEVREQLTAATTVSVEEEGSEAFLLLHVLDPEAEPLGADAPLEGVDSGLELTLRRAGAGASKVLERIGSSEWVRDAKGAVSEMEKEVESVDWGEKERQIREHLEEARRDLDEAASGSAEEAKDAYRMLREEMKKIAEELESLGRSEEAKKLRERIDRLFEAPES